MFFRRPGMSSERSGWKGVTGNAIAPLSLLRSSSGFMGSPSGQNALPVGIDVLAHFGGVVALAVRMRSIALSAASKLIVVELNTQAGLVRDSYAAIDDGDAPSRDDFV